MFQFATLRLQHIREVAVSRQSSSFCLTLLQKPPISPPRPIFSLCSLSVKKYPLLPPAIFRIVPFNNAVPEPSPLPLLSSHPYTESRTMTTLWSEASDGAASSNIYINHIPSSYSDTQVRELLEPYGTVVRLKYGEQYALAEYENIAQATAAVMNLHGSTPTGGYQTLVVEFNTYGRKRQRNDALFPQLPVSHTNLYLNHLPLDMDQAALEALLTRFGTLSRAKIGIGEGWGLAEYTTPESASAALAGLNGKSIHGCTEPVAVEFHFQSGNGKGPKGFKGAKCLKGSKKGGSLKGGKKGISCRNLYINNLPGGFTEENVRGILQPFGTIVRLKVEKSGDTRSWALAEMSAASEALSYGIAFVVNNLKKTSDCVREKNCQISVILRPFW